MRKFILNLLNIKTCQKCGSTRLEDGYWTRGWNNFCEQASGDNGTRCFDCGYIVWKQSVEDYKKSSPYCTVYERTNNEI